MQMHTPDAHIAGQVTEVLVPEFAVVPGKRLHARFTHLVPRRTAGRGKRFTRIQIVKRRVGRRINGSLRAARKDRQRGHCLRNGNCAFLRQRERLVWERNFRGGSCFRRRRSFCGIRLRF